MKRYPFSVLVLGVLLVSCGPVSADPEVVAKAVEGTLQAQASAPQADTMATAVAATLEPQTAPIDSDTPPTAVTAPTESAGEDSFQTAAEGTWATYASEESVEPFADFVIAFPTTWWLQVEKTFFQMGDGMEPAEASVNLTLRNGDYAIRISRPGLGWDAAGCLYPEDPPLEGMYARYGEYREFQKPGGIAWRRAAPVEMAPDGWTAVVCELHADSGRFLGFTSVGFLSLNGPKADGRALGELDAILERIVVKKQTSSRMGWIRPPGRYAGNPLGP